MGLRPRFDGRRYLWQPVSLQASNDVPRVSIGQFLRIYKKSLAEVETILLVVQGLGCCIIEYTDTLKCAAQEIGRLWNGLINSLNTTH